MSLKKSVKLLEGFIHLYFRVAVAEFKAEHSIDKLEHHIALFIHYFIYSWCSSDSLMFFVSDNNIKSSLYSFSLLLCFLYNVAFLTLKVTNLFLYKDIQFNDPLPLLIKFGVRANIYLKYICYPLTLWAFFGIAFGSQEKGLIFWFLGIFSLIFGSIFTFLLSMYQKNTIPSDSFVSSFETTTEIPILITFTAGSILGQYSHNLPSDQKSLSGVLFGSILFINLSIAIFYSVHRKYWNPEANLVTMRYSYWICLLTAWHLGTLGIKPSYMVLLMLVTFIQAEKIARNMNNKFMMVDVFNPKLNVSKKLFAFFIMEDVIAKKILGLKSESDDLYIYFSGLIQKYFDKRGTPERTAEVCTDLNKLNVFLAKHLLPECKTLDTIKLALRLHMLNLLDNILVVKQLISKMNELSQMSLAERLECYHLLQLLNAKIEGHYQEKDLSGSFKQKSLSKQYFHITNLSNLDVGSTFINIARPLEQKNYLEAVNESIKRISSKKQKIFEYVAEMAETSKPNAHLLQKKNNSVMKDIIALDKSLKKTIEDPKMMPLYYYPCICSYYSMVRYDFEALQVVRSRYKKDLQSWKIIMAKPVTEKKEDLDHKQVIMRISLSHATMGQIVETTANADLKFSKEGANVVGRNINDFFPPSIGERHKGMMRKMQGFSNMINKKNKFVIKSVENYLMQVYFTLKLQPLINTEFYSVVSLSFLENEKESMVILSDQMEILDCEATFWKKMDKSKSIKHRETKIEKLIPKIPIAIRLAKAFKKIKHAVGSQHIKVDKNSSLEDLLKLISDFEALNRQKHIEYSCNVQSESNWLRAGREVNCYCRIEDLTFDGVAMHSLFVSFVDVSAFGPAQVRPKDKIPAKNPLVSTGSVTVRPRNDSMLDSDIDSEEYERLFLQEMYLGKVHPFGSVMKSLKRILGDIQENELKFCHSEIKEPLLNLSALVALHDELFEKDTKETRPKRKKIQTKTILNPIEIVPSYSAIFNPDAELQKEELKKAATPTLPDAADKTEYIFKVKNNQFQEDNDPKVPETPQEPGIFQDVDELIRKHQERIETPTYYKGKAKMKATQSPIYFKKKKMKNEKEGFKELVKTEMEPMNSKKRPKFKTVSQVIMTLVKLSKVGVDHKATTQQDKSLDSIGDLNLREQVKNSLTIDASSIVSNNGKSKNKRAAKLKSLKLIFNLGTAVYFLFYLIIHLSCWLSFKNSTESNFQIPKNIMNITDILSSYYFMGSEAILAYSDVIALEVSASRGLESESDLVPLTSNLGFETTEDYFHEFFEDVIGEFEHAAQSLKKMIIESRSFVDQFSVLTDRFDLNYTSDTFHPDFAKLPASNLIEAINLMDILLEEGFILHEIALAQEIDKENSLEFKRFQEISELLSRHMHQDFLNKIQTSIGLELLTLVNEESKTEERITFIIIGLLSALTLVNSGIALFSLLKFQSRLSNILGSYCSLTHDDVDFELQVLASVTNFFSKTAPLETIKDETIGLKLDNGDKFDVRQFVNHNTKKLKVRKNVLKKRKGVFSVDGSSSLIVQYPYRSVFISMLLIVFLILCSLVVLIFMLVIKKERNAVIFVATASINNNIKCMNLHEGFAKYFIFSPYSAFIFDVSTHSGDLAVDTYHKAVEDYNSFWMQTRDELKDKLTNIVDLNDMVYNDYCDMLYRTKILHTPDGEEIDAPEDLPLVKACDRKALWGSQGFNQYLLFESSKLNEVSNLLKEIMGPVAKGELKEEELFIELSKIWFNPSFVELRFIHHEIFEFIFLVSQEKFKIGVHSRIDRGTNFLFSFNIAVILMTVIPIVFMYLPTIRNLEKDYQISLFTFELIHPGVISMNQYLKSKQKLFVK